MRNLSGLGLLAVLGACGGSNSASGTVEGASLSVRDALSFQATLTADLPDGGAVYLVGFVLTDTSGICADIAAQRSPPSTTILSVGVEGFQPITLGTYPVSLLPNPDLTVAAFVKADANCQSAVSDEATSGSVTFSAISSGQASGTFDLTFPDAGHLTGSFSAPNCAAFQNALLNPDAGTNTCG
jgi:hypothetical protein